MDPLSLFGMQFTLSLVIFALVAKWYISPALDKRSMEDALVPLFLVHTLRYLPSSGFAPGPLDGRYRWRRCPRLHMEMLHPLSWPLLPCCFSGFDGQAQLRLRGSSTF